MINKRRKVVLASLLAGVFIFQQSMLMSVIAASTISGVTNGGSGTFNIDPLSTKNGTGIRNYTDFNLGEGDIANLNMKGIESFINLVDNKATINGLLNTTRDGAFYNGKAIFVSPNGVVIGPSGVINAGSFTAVSPTQGIYEGFKNRGENLTVSEVEANSSSSAATGLGGPIEVNGKILTRGDVKIYSNGFNVGQNGAIYANVNSEAANTIDKATLDTLFNQLVNTNGIISNSQQQFVKNGAGNLEIRSASGVNIAGNVINYANGAGSSTVIHNTLNDADNIGTNITGNVTANAGDLNISNDRGNMAVSGNIRNNNGTTEIYNIGHSNFNPLGNSKLTISGNVNSNGNLKISNTGKDGADITGTINTTSGNTTIMNGFNTNDKKYDIGALNITGTVNTTAGNLDATNYAAGSGGLKVASTGVLKTKGNATVRNYGEGGLSIAGAVDTTNGKTSIINGYEEGAAAPNMTGALNITGNVTTTDGDLEVINHTSGADGLNITDNAKLTTTGNAALTNYGSKGLNFKNNAKSSSTGTTTISNYGEAGLNLNDNADVSAKGNLAMYNNGAKGITIQPYAKASSGSDVTITNEVANGADTDKGAVRVQGHVKSTGSTTIKSTGGDVILGDNSNGNGRDDANVFAGKNINITTKNASILNYAHNSGIEKLHAYDTGNGTAKTLLTSTNGDLTMNAENGRIGDYAGGVCLSGDCTGIGEEGTRDFNKSINANIKGRTKATTVDTTAAKENEYVINYAAIDSDMNLDTLNANGRVVLTVDESSDGNHTQYNIKNLTNDPSKANIEGWGLSVISSGDIGTAGEKVTFNQTKAGTLRTAAEDGLTAGKVNPHDGYGMDVLANGDVYMKALDDDKNIVNNVCSMVSRNGSMNVEFGGNTYIEEVTAKDNVNLITRGKTMEINHLGTVPSLGDNGQSGPKEAPAHTYDTYLGPGDRIDDPEYDMSTPNNAVVKALDINKNIRPDGAYDVPGYEGYYANADSTAVVRNGMLEITDPNGTGNLDITADNVYGNGIAAHFTDDGFTKEVDPRTNPTVGGNTPSGHAVRPDDVSGIGRDIHERNYYYPEGDGDIPDENRPDNFKPATPDGNVDPDDGVVDATPLVIPKDNPGPGPGPKPDPEPDNPDNPPVNPDNPPVNPDNPDNPDNPTIDADDDRTYWKKQDDNFVQAIDKRQYMRFNVSDNKNPVAMEKTDNGIDSLLDVSRGGIAVRHDGSLKVGDVVPVHISYADLDINADVKVVSATTTRAGAEFVNLDKATANQLLYLSILLEDANNVAFKR